MKHTLYLPCWMLFFLSFLVDYIDPSNLQISGMAGMVERAKGTNVIIWTWKNEFKLSINTSAKEWTHYSYTSIVWLHNTWTLIPLLMKVLNVKYLYPERRLFDDIFDVVYLLLTGWSYVTGCFSSPVASCSRCVMKRSGWLCLIDNDVLCILYSNINIAAAHLLVIEVLIICFVPGQLITVVSWQNKVGSNCWLNIDLLYD